LFFVEIASEAHARRNSWKRTVKVEATVECGRFGDTVPQRVLLYSKPGRAGVEMMIIVMSAEYKLMGIFFLQLTHFISNVSLA